jgi:hypothetical protein
MTTDVKFIYYESKIIILLLQFTMLFGLELQ